MWHVKMPFRFDFELRNESGQDMYVYNTCSLRLIVFIEWGNPLTIPMIDCNWEGALL